MLHGGVLFGIPALFSQGLEQFFKVFHSLSPGFYGLHHIVLTMCFMFLSRIKNPEQLKGYPPGELGKLLGLDRVPEVGHFRHKLGEIINQSKSDELHKVLFQEWLQEMPQHFFYIDGHVKVYHGKKANLQKRYVSREQLCLSGTTEFWINEEGGNPLMVITEELNEKLKASVESAVESILPELPAPGDSQVPVFTMIFDRESYEPSWFQKLWDQHQVAIITYRKNVQYKWGEAYFKNRFVQIFGTNVEMQLCECQVELDGYQFREIRKLGEGGHQVAVLTTHPSLEMEKAAAKIFNRWYQENFFKYINENFDLDRVLEYGIEEIAPQRTVPNPPYQRLSNRLKKAREQKGRIEAKLFQKLERNDKENITIDEAMKSLSQSSELLEQLRVQKAYIEQLIKERSQYKARVSVEEMPEEKRYNKLKTESKKFKNALIMLVYRAETALLNYITPYFKYSYKEGRALLQTIFTTNADFYPDYKNGTLTVTLHSLASPRTTEAARKLCELLNDTETYYPYTNLRLIFKTMAD